MMLRGVILAFLVSAPSIAAAQCKQAEAQEADKSEISIKTEWVRVGLQWIKTTSSQTVVDKKRIICQQKQGCSETQIKFGDTALMRQSVDLEPWPEAVRRKLAAANISDDAGQVYDFLQAAATNPELEASQVVAIELIAATFALQLNDQNTASEFLAKMKAKATPVPDPLAADMKFLEALLSVHGRKAWTKEDDRLFGEALALDPDYFSARVYRLLSWLQTYGRTAVVTNCSASVAEFSKRLLDVSEASACPLMVGHVDHVLQRELQSKPFDADLTPLKTWQIFGIGLMAKVTNNEPVFSRVTSHLAGGDASLPCLSQITSELASLSE